LDDGHSAALNKAIDEVNARGGHTIAITSNMDLIKSKPRDVIMI
jgi:hypothetical protein